LAADEATKDKVSVTEVSDIVSLGFESPLSQAISVPTLIGDDARDGLFCGPLARDCSSAATLEASQAPYFSPSACLQTFVQPGAGHSIALSLNSRYGFRSMLTWADSYVGSSSSPAVLPDPSCG
jgi:hypothetical protein